MARAELQEIIEEATTDAFGDEIFDSWLFVLEEHLELPFTAKLLGRKVSVVEFKLSPLLEPMAVCEAGGERASVPVRELQLPARPPEGAEALEAYKLWASDFLRES